MISNGRINVTVSESFRKRPFQETITILLGLTNRFVPKVSNKKLTKRVRKIMNSEINWEHNSKIISKRI